MKLTWLYWWGGEKKKIYVCIYATVILNSFIRYEIKIKQYEIKFKQKGFYMTF